MNFLRCAVMGAAVFLSSFFQSNSEAATLDPSLPPTNVGYGILRVGYQSDGKILVAGTTHFDGKQSGTNLLRLKNDGTLDGAFPPTKLSPNLIPFNGSFFTNPPTVNALVIQLDDKILVGGFFDGVNGSPRTNLARLNADGTVDTAFNALPDNTVLTVVPVSGGYLVGGSFKKIGGVARLNIAKLHGDGSLDTSFNPGWSPSTLGGTIQAIAVQPDGRILAGGASATFSGGFTYQALFRFEANGTLDSAFKVPSLPNQFQSVSALALQADGNIIAAGTFGPLGGVARADVARLSSTGTVDPAWGGAGVQGNGLTDHVKTMVQQADGKIVLGGTFIKFSDVNRKGFVRLQVNGTVDPSFDYQDGSTTWAGALALQPDGRILAAGTFTIGTSTYTLIRLAADGGGPAMPVITSQPAGQTAKVGQTIMLTVAAAGGSLSYQWFHDDIALVGQTESTLTLANIQAAHSGKYHVVVNNSASSIKSDEVSVIVNAPPVITVQPSSLFVDLGETARLTVLATGTASLSYEWQFNGAVLSNATANALILQNVQLNQSGRYKVVVKNSAGEVTSTEVTLTVTLPPATIIEQPASQTVAATADVPLPNCANLSALNLPGVVLTMVVREGAAPFASTGTYSITLDQSGGYALSANGINPARSGTWSFGPDLGITTVLTVNNYFGDARVTHWALLANCEYELYADNMVSSQGGTYSVTGGTSGTAENVTFKVVATGPEPITYQWFHDGSEISGATQPTLVVKAIVANAGAYTVKLTNPAGTISSDPAVLTIAPTSTGASIQFTSTKDKLNLSWPAGYAVQSSTSLGVGAWAPVAGASPQSFDFSGRQQFFRLVRPN